MGYLCKIWTQIYSRKVDHISVLKWNNLLHQLRARPLKQFCHLAFKNAESALFGLFWNSLLKNKLIWSFGLFAFSSFLSFFRSWKKKKFLGLIFDSSVLTFDCQLDVRAEFSNNVSNEYDLRKRTLNATFWSNGITKHNFFVSIFNGYDFITEIRAIATDQWVNKYQYFVQRTLSVPGMTKYLWASEKPV